MVAIFIEFIIFILIPSSDSWAWRGWVLHTLTLDWARASRTNRLTMRINYYRGRMVQRCNTRNNLLCF